MNIDSQECPKCEKEFFVVSREWIPEKYDYDGYHGKHKPLIVKAKHCPFCGQPFCSEELD